MTFVAKEVAFEIFRELKEPMKVLKTKDSYLYDQAKRAAVSVCANVTEGSRRVGRDKRHFYRIALGSASELGTHLREAEAWDFLSGLDKLYALIDRQERLLVGLTRAGGRGARSSPGSGGAA